MLRSPAIVLVLVAAACGSKPSPPAAVARDAAPTATSVVDAAAAARPLDLADALAGLATGPVCLVVRSPDGAVHQSDAAACAERLRPMSTFKVPNALIGADVGLIDGPDAILPYDGTKYPAPAGSDPGWSKDQPLRNALLISAVPAFRLLASKIGAARMQAHLDAFAYGNRDLSGGIDQFWLDGSLEISAVEQVAFLDQAVSATLPVSAQALATVREAMPAETAAGAVLRWKTGTGGLGKPEAGRIGWLVGWIESPGASHVFACWVKTPAGDVEATRAYRLRVCRGALDRLKLFPSAAP